MFSAIFPALARKPKIERPAVLIPNPFYQAYAAAAAASGAVPVFLPSTAEAKFLPALGAIDDGAARADHRPLSLHAVKSARRRRRADPISRAPSRWRGDHDFLLFADECYSEIYGDAPPPGTLETAYAETGSLANVVAFQSLSKRSGLPGLRSGFIAGDPEFIAAFGRFRNVACPQVPLPVQHVSAKAWADERHVEEGRALYRRNFAIASGVLEGRYGYRQPGGSFFLWLKMAAFGGGEEAAKTLWKGCGVRVLPGTYLAQAEPDGVNPGKDYIRVALVHDADTTREALTRIVATLG